ncbi:unnamed protein product [Aphis gossypii]|uniref:Uncharacterized protein n=1 Tax=Aphis gossypii TaxID=80765 RepID=A0A9P0J3W1_APHGO|nr:unnamed protein product [Aphis gossypii]
MFSFNNILLPLNKVPSYFIVCLSYLDNLSSSDNMGNVFFENFVRFPFLCKICLHLLFILAYSKSGSRDLY